MNEIAEAQLRREAAALMGRARTEKKIAAVRENGRKGGRPKGPGRPYSDEAKLRMCTAQQARRARERAENGL